MNYYNEFDPKAAAWLRALIAAGHIPAGIVDERSIADVSPHDLDGYAQCHFFAGIAGWSLALALAGWSESRPVWTGSCPCQPFSPAGKRKAENDPRHLWPHFFRLIADRNPPVVFGEQVAGPAGLRWLAGVRSDLDRVGYAVGAADLCAAGIGAPHIRPRLYWLADSHAWGCNPGDREGRSTPAQREGGHGLTEQGGSLGRLALAGRKSTGRGDDRPAKSSQADHARASGFARGSSHPGGLAFTEYGGRQGGHSQWQGTGPALPSSPAVRLGNADCAGSFEGRVAATPNGHGRSPLADGRPWNAFDLLPCLDGKARRVEPGTFPLAHGVPARVGRLRGYGNAIVPWLAAEFVEAYLDTLAERGWA